MAGATLYWQGVLGLRQPRTSIEPRGRR